MRVLAAFGLGVLFVLGALLGVGLGAVFFVISWARRGRAVHREGVVCRAEVVPHDHPVGRALAGPTVVRLSGAFGDQQPRGSDVLGMMVRWQRAVHEGAAAGEQDLLFGTFESFRTAARDRAATNVGDYLANRYSTVTPWWTPGVGVCVLRLSPAARVTERRSDPVTASVNDAQTAHDTPLLSRLDRLDAALARDSARMILLLEHGDSSTEIGELRLIERTATPDHQLRASMFRCQRGLRPVGFRNGLRATLYPMSQRGRGLRAR
jgi:hypothetical protein